ncbi:MAG TPA: hypothetical protein VFE30_04320 [Anaeromyxobacteraceae bacterium]|nr:hypothetical protein [Anaeromyxobacteraceae bacterium]
MSRKILDGKLGVVAAGLAGTASGLIVRKGLEALFGAVGKGERLAVRLDDPVSQRIASRYGPALAVQVTVTPRSPLPAGVYAAFRLRVGRRFLECSEPKFADDKGRYLAENPLIEGEGGKLLAGALVPLRALPADAPQRVTLATLVYNQEGKRLGLEEFDVDLPPTAP